MQSVIAELNSILGEQLIERFHTDEGKEFMNKAMDEMLINLHIFQTGSGGQDPQAHGRAERYVGLIKQR